MIRWLFLIVLSLSVVACSPAYAYPTTMPQINYEKVSQSLVEAPERDHLECLALNIFHEARDQGTQGWLAVAFVTINRVIDPRFPDSICEVVWEPKQFSWTHDGKSDVPNVSKYPDKKAWEYIKEFSKGFLENFRHIEDPTKGSLYYHNFSVEPSWRDDFEVATEVGEHIFYINRGKYR